MKYYTNKYKNGFRCISGIHFCIYERAFVALKCESITVKQSCEIRFAGFADLGAAPNRNVCISA